MTGVADKFEDIPEQARERILKRWRDQGRTEADIVETIRNWGQRKFGDNRPYLERVGPLDENPYEGMSAQELRRMQQDLRNANSGLQGQQKRVRQHLASISEALKGAEVEEDDIIITDHALVRWLERDEGVDFEPLRAKLREMVRGKVNPTMEHAVVVTEEGTLVVRSPCTVVTALSPEQVPPREGQMTANEDADF